MIFGVMIFLRINILLLLLSVIGHNHSEAQRKPGFTPKQLYQSERLVIIQVAPHSFQHISYLQTNDFGNVPCNGLIVRDSNETIVYDTPTSDSVSMELIKWINDSLHCSIRAIIPTHFHNDCLAGLKAFHEKGVPSYAFFKTIELAKKNNYTLPQNSFRDSLVLNVGKKTTITKFFGEGHTIDNVVGYFPADKVLFGGCLIKEIDASKGFLGDANVKAWSATVEKVKKAYPDLRKVIPGHGDSGDRRLLDYTIRLFNPSK